MSFSISTSTPFSAINWDNFENRPPINESMKFCGSADRYKDTKCCMETDSIEGVLYVAHKNDLRNADEVKFLEEYPCVNWVELDSLADKIDEQLPETTPTPVPTSPQPPRQCIPMSVRYVDSWTYCGDGVFVLRQSISELKYEKATTDFIAIHFLLLYMPPCS